MTGIERFLGKWTLESEKVAYELGPYNNVSWYAKPEGPK